MWSTEGVSVSVQHVATSLAAFEHTIRLAERFPVLGQPPRSNSRSRIERHRGLISRVSMVGDEKPGLCE